MSRTAFAVLLSSAIAFADDAAPKTFAEYLAKHEFVCNGPLETLPTAEVREFGGFKYELLGSSAKVRRTSPRKGPLKIGVIAATKDADPETLALLETFFAEFDKQDVELIFVGGDTAEEPKMLDAVYAWLAKRTQRPVLTVAGNSERPSAHNYAINKVREAGAENLINMGIVRRVDADGVDVVSLSGYYDKAYLHMRGACIYGQPDLDTVVEAAKQADDPVVLLSHGPPAQKGKDAVDFVPSSGNVGDPQILAAIKAAKISFGVHGHILEAAGRATDLSGKPLKQGKSYPSFFLNPGSANPLPWKLNSGATSYGLAAIVTVEGKQARWAFLKGEKPSSGAAAAKESP